MYRPRGMLIDFGQAMISERLRSTLEATGYLVNGRPAANTVSLPQSAHSRWLPSLRPDAWWRSGWARHFGDNLGATNLTVLFKFTESGDEPVADWQREVWNLGCAPLLWVVSPDGIDLYNGFGRPQLPGAEHKNRLHTFDHSTEQLDRLNDYAGRLAMETGRFWQEPTGVDRSTGVDRLLLRDLGTLESDLANAGLDHQEAQGLIGRIIFAKYLIDRKIVTAQHLRDVCGHCDLPDILRDRGATERLFAWLRERFNGDMFPKTLGAPPESKYLRRVASFLRAEAPVGQMSLFPYRFDVIPVELISSIYERFVHSAAAVDGEEKTQIRPRTQGVYYTPLTVVSLVLDEVFDGLTGNETVIDLTCGSGVFLVEALRRLVRLKANGEEPTRDMVVEALYGQVYGVDISDSAVQVAAFSLYLAALELDPDPREFRFEPLVGKTLLAGDSHSIEDTEAGKSVLAIGSDLRTFDVVVGNPPWTYEGRTGTAARRKRGPGVSRSPRGGSLDFIRRGRDFAHDETRFGVLVSAAPFFARSKTGLQAVQDTVESLGSVTLVNLSDLSPWLFDKANMPAMALLARIPGGRAGAMELVQVRRSLEGDRSRTIAAAPRDVVTLPFASWKRNPDLLKAGFLGADHDLLLLDGLWERCKPLSERLSALGTKVASGSKRGNRSGEAGHLKGLPFLSAGQLTRFVIPTDLPDFDWSLAEHPRERAVYYSPIVVVKESISSPEGGLQDGRAVVAVTERDIVYKDVYFGVSLRGHKPDIGYLLAGILSSGLASWYFMMAGSSFGVWKRILRHGDVSALPTPDLAAALRTAAGERVIRHARRFHQQPPEGDDWQALDEAVCDLYELDEEQRIVVADGRLRATWQWKAGRDAAAAAADVQVLREYAQAFLLSMDAWFQAASECRLRAEIYDTRRAEPLRVIRFILEDDPPPSHTVVRRDMSLPDLLADIDTRLGVAIAEELVGVRELRIHASREVVIVKPAARHFWLGVGGLDDARAVLTKSFAGDTG